MGAPGYRQNLGIPQGENPVQAHGQKLRYTEAQIQRSGRDAFAAASGT